MQVHAYAAKSPKQNLEPFQFDLGELGPNEVDVRITHCGICHSDVAMVDNNWGMSHYPLLRGHEIVGTVAAVGSNVDRLTIGQRVGVGPICGACMKCEWCERGAQHVCAKIVGTTLHGHQGGFGTIVRVNNWQFAFPIPEGIASEHAGPLMCAGATVFTPLLRHGVRPTDRVAVVGIGGLGHLALQYLSQWGCDVTAISSTHEKDEMAHGFGATHHIATRGTDELSKAARSFDFILSTVSADLPWDGYVAALRPQGKPCIVGVPEKSISFSAFNLMFWEKAVVGGQPGYVHEIQQMLAFSAKHGIKPMIETFPLAEANAALDHTPQGNARFRAVLVA
jgi:uncharacterized zinc-type alcohol dehydrogenase-like protein